jgi:4-diphosphocytidyl-2-C-methyl-D-erythritol kinase
MKGLAPAKVNLYLKVLGKRPDGYHDIATLMHRISLFDELEIHPMERGIVLRCPDSSLPEDERNIVYRAAKSILSFTSSSSGVAITLRKKIPLAAGLGGGSSDAATTLTTINELFKFNLPKSTLIEIGTKLGADVPFFIFDRPAWAFGVGERLKSTDPLPAMWLVLVNPGFEVSTKMVYENLNFELTKKISEDKIPSFEKLTDIVKILHNDLEMVTLGLFPVLSEIKERLVKLGARGSLMSGSGPTVFGIFQSEDHAERAEAALRKSTDYCVFRVHTV